MDSEASPTEQLEKLEGVEDFPNLLNKVKEAAADIKPASKPQRNQHRHFLYVNPVQPY